MVVFFLWVFLFVYFLLGVFGLVVGFFWVFLL